jgi:hypothetical protein
MGVLFAYYLGVELAFWSIAVAQLTGHSERGSWRRTLNPPIIAIHTAIVLNGFGAKAWIPLSIATTYHLLAVCAVPMAFLLSGALTLTTSIRTRCGMEVAPFLHQRRFALGFSQHSSCSSRKLHRWTSP